MLKIILIVAVFLSGMTLGLAQEAGKYSIKQMTSQVRQALDNRRERFGEISSLKASGIVGENNRGYVERLKNDVNAQGVVDQENNDRSVIYQAIAQQNGLEGELSTIESAFGQIESQRSKPGDMIQTPDGRWIAK